MNIAPVSFKETAVLYAVMESNFSSFVKTFIVNVSTKFISEIITAGINCYINSTTASESDGSFFVVIL